MDVEGRGRLWSVHGRINRVLAVCFYAVATLVFAWLVGNIAATTTGNSLANVLLAVFMAAGVCLLYRFLAPAVNTMASRFFSILVVAGFVLWGVLLYLMGYQLLAWPVTDLRYVLETVEELLTDGQMTTWHWYFSIWPNNLALVHILYVLFWPLHRIGVPVFSKGALAAALALDVLAILLAVFFTYKVAGLLFPQKSARLLVLLLSFLFVPYLLWAPYPYTDVLSLWFPVAVVWLHLSAHGRPFVRAWGHYVAAGLLLGGGYCIKPSVLIAGVAIAIHLLLREKVPVALAKAAILAVGFLVVLGGHSAIINITTLFNSTNLAQTQSPVSYWLAMGSHNTTGWCGCEECSRILPMPDYAERNAAYWRLTWNSYAQRGAAEQLAFFTEKGVNAWGTGDYDALKFLQAPTKGSWTHAFIVPTGRFYAPLQYYCSAYNLCLLAGFVASLAYNFKKGFSRDIFLVHLVLFGALLFFLVWEMHARHILLVVPLRILAAADGLMQVEKRLPRRKNPRRTPRRNHRREAAVYKGEYFGFI